MPARPQNSQPFRAPPDGVLSARSSFHMLGPLPLSCGQLSFASVLRTGKARGLCRDCREAKVETRSTPRLRCMRSHSGAPAGPAPNLRLLYRERQSFQKGGAEGLKQILLHRSAHFLATRRSGDPLGPASASIRSLQRDVPRSCCRCRHLGVEEWSATGHLDRRVGDSPSSGQSQVILQKVWGPPG